MKTISVIFTKEKLNLIPSSTKRYTFNTESEVKEGDLIEIEGYRGKQQVVELKKSLYKFYDSTNGNLYEEQPSLAQNKPEIKEVTCRVVELF